MTGFAIADDVFIGPNAVFTNVRTPRAFVSRKDAIRADHASGAARPLAPMPPSSAGTVIGDYAHDRCGRGGDRRCRAACARWPAIPARRIGWVSTAGEILGADLVCPRTGEKYVVTDAGLAVAGR